MAKGWNCFPVAIGSIVDSHRDEYADQLLAVSQKGAWTQWINFFLRGVAEQAHDATERSQRLLKEFYSMREKVTTARVSALTLKLIDDLLIVPVLTIPMAQRSLEVTYRSAQLNVLKLVEAGILREITQRNRNRVYVADKIMSIVNVEPASA